MNQNNSNDISGEAIQRLGDASTPTVWSEFGRLAQENDVANLGQGFPNWLPPQFAIDSLVEAATDTIDKSPHQYTRTAGHPSLVNMLAARYSTHLNRHIDPMKEVSVTVGASQALYMCLQTLVKPGDEVILFEPFFDLYVNQVKLAGGTPVYVPLTFVPYNDINQGSTTTVSGGEWILEPQSIENAITSKTRAIILNSPHNPTGKLFTRTEMEYIASAVETKANHNCVVLSDEVYKYIVHSPPKDDDNDTVKTNSNKNYSNKTVSDINHEILNVDNNNNNNNTPHKTAAISCPGHTHFASLPNMYDRTITISSAGKTFSATGWQVGWCIGPSHLIAPIHQLLPYVQFCASTVIQETLARTLQKAEEPYEGYTNYYEYLKAMYTKKRDMLGMALQSSGFGIPDYTITPGGGFFIFARIGPEILNAIPKERLLKQGHDDNDQDIVRSDWALCKWLAEEKGILCIPSSPFFSKQRVMEGASDEFIRIAFCKTQETIEKAASAFMRLKAEVMENDQLQDRQLALTKSINDDASYDESVSVVAIDTTNATNVLAS